METLDDSWTDKIKYPKVVYCETCKKAFFKGEARVATDTGYKCWDCHLNG